MGGLGGLPYIKAVEQELRHGLQVENLGLAGELELG